MKAVIFDMDGVLVNSEPVIMKAAKEALAEGGIQASYDDFKPFIGAGEEYFILSLCEKHQRQEQAGTLMERMFSLFEENVGQMQVYPSARPLIEALRERGVRLALVSSAARRKLLASLRAAGISPDCFEVLLSGSDVTEKKPSPQPYRLAAEQLGLSPGECLVIEDAINGIRSAKAAGMHCAAVATSFAREELERAGADAVLSDLSEAADLIDG